MMEISKEELGIEHLWADHIWKDSYYGLVCKCGAFIPYGCEPWMLTNGELHEMLMFKPTRQ